MYDHLSFHRLVVTEGTSNKFWEVAIDGQKLVIRFGRIGTKGQTQVKTFAGTGEAVREKEKMIQEKLSRGYRTNE